MSQLCRIIHHTRLTDDILRMTLDAESIAQTCTAGQFVHIKVSPHIDPLLRRPFSVHRADRKKGTIDILYRVIGRGTELMSRMLEGDTVDVMGPLGNGFRFDGGFSRAVVVAGGMGSAPVFFLIDSLLNREKEVILLWGTRRADEFFEVQELKKRGVDVRLATDDGSEGHSGVVTELLEEYLEGNHDSESMVGFGCGPEAMLACVQSIAAKTVFPWQASLEETMACGLGVCQGCAVKMMSGAFRMACSDGPVFDLGEVVFDG